MLPHSTKRRSPRDQKINSRRLGYPKLAAFMNSDQDFAVFRSFGELYVRLLLYKQDELRLLEERLHELDNKELTAFSLCCRQADTNIDRPVLLNAIEQKLLEYGTLQAQYFKTLDSSKPRRKQMKSVANWLDGNKPLTRSDSSFLEDEHDLVTARIPSDKGRLNDLVEDILVSLMRCISPARFANTDDGHVFITSHSIIATLARGLSTAIAVAALIAPVVVLYFVTSMKSRIWIIASFTFLFSAGLTWMTPSRQYEIFSATAAFCAVMVVFISNVPSAHASGG